MYRFEGEKIAKVRGTKERVYLTEKALTPIMELGKKYNSIDKAVKEMKENGLIDASVSLSTYKKNLYALDSYKEWLQEKEQFKKQFDKDTQRLFEGGMNMYKISKYLNVTYAKVWNSLNRDKKKVKDKTYQSKLKTAKKIVDYWNNNRLQGSIMTTQTRNAFKLLGLEPPKNK